MPERKSLYISGPISQGNMRENLDRGIDAGYEAWEAGWLPFIPHLGESLVNRHNMSYEAIMAYDLQWVERCDALLRISGESPGAEREVALAKRLGKTVLYHA